MPTSASSTHLERPPRGHECLLEPRSTRRAGLGTPQSGGSVLGEVLPRLFGERIPGLCFPGTRGAFFSRGIAIGFAWNVQRTPQGLQVCLEPLGCLQCPWRARTNARALRRHPGRRARQPHTEERRLWEAAMPPRIGLARQSTAEAPPDLAAHKRRRETRRDRGRERQIAAPREGARLERATSPRGDPGLSAPRSRRAALPSDGRRASGGALEGGAREGPRGRPRTFFA